MVDPGSGDQPLRTNVLQGGSYLMVREVVGMLIRLGGVVTVTRIIGPHEYGIYVAAVAVTALVAAVSQLGAEVWLIRRPEEPTSEIYQQCFSTLLVVSAVVVLVSLGLSWPVGLLIHQSREVLVFRLLLISVPVNILWAPAQAKIERNFGYRQMAWLEIGGDVALYGTSVPLALTGMGVWAPTIGYIAWQSALFVGSAALAGLAPRWRWDSDVARAVVRNGITYSSTTWIDRLQGLINPVIVGAFSGSTGVGIVGLALRLVDTAGFALRASWRLGMAAISRIHDQPDRLRGALEEGLLAQALALGVPMAGLAVLSPWLVPFVFGRAWRGAAVVYGVLALGRLVASVSLPQMTVLFARGRNSLVVLALVVNAAMLAVLSLIFVPVDGILGFAWASLLSTTAWLILDRSVRATVGFSYSRSVPAIIGLGIPMLSPLAPWPWRLLLCIPLLVPLLVDDCRRSMVGFARIALDALFKRSRAPAESP